MNAHPHPKDAHGKQWEYYTDMPVGEILRRARNHYGQSLNDVEAILRIRAAQLAALEDGKLELLPGRVYAIGFVRAYSEYLGLDGDKMVHLFKIQSVGSKARPELTFPVPASESKVPGLLLLGVSFAAVVIIIVLFSFFSPRGMKNSAQEEIPAVSPQLKAEAQTPVPTALPAQTTAAQPAPQAAATAATVAATGMAAIPGQPAKPVSRVVINIKDNTWVEIRNSSGKPLISQVLNPGDSYIVPNEQGLVLATGNIGGLEFVVDGQAIPPLGNKGDVARGVRLDPELLKPGHARAAVQAPAPQQTLIQQPVAQQPAQVQQAAPAWQSAIHPAAQQQGPVVQAQTAPQPVPVRKPAPRPKRPPPSDEAYQPYKLPGAASGTAGGGYNGDE